MKVKEVAALIEAFAPLTLQQEYDNCGLNIGSYEQQVSGVLLAVDVTQSVLEEAQAKGANLIITHHPLLFHPLRQLVDADSTQRIAAGALRAGISLYAAHTNLDAAPGGLSFFLGEILGLEQMEVLAPHATFPGAGYGVVGELFAGPTAPLDFLRFVSRKLQIGALRYSTICKMEVRRIALCTGSGSSFIRHAQAAEADLYLAADFRYNDFYLPNGKMVVADAGHFETECCAIDLLYAIITKKIATFAVHKSKQINPVNYLV